MLWDFGGGVVYLFKNRVETIGFFWGMYQFFMISGMWQLSYAVLLRLTPKFSPQFLTFDIQYLLNFVKG